MSMRREYILCVDDEAPILASLRLELGREFGEEMAIMTATSGHSALALIEELKAEGSMLALVVSDQRMPGMDGSELMSRIRETDPDVLFIMLTGFTDLDALKKSVNDAGLFRFISKPWTSLDLTMACRRAIGLRASDLLNKRLIAQLESLNRTIIAVLESVIDCNDPETYDHIRKVSCYSAVIATAAGMDVLFQRKLLAFSSLHDLGKVGIPQHILNKPGKLDPGEMAIMRTHVIVGERLIHDLDVDPIVREIISGHHERWDGKGYPTGLAGEAIPLSARVVAIADVFDALLSERPYKKAMDFDSACNIILASGGSQFDPKLVEAFALALDELRVQATGDEPGRCFDYVGLGAR
jgi:putative two-component system response regulator